MTKYSFYYNINLTNLSDVGLKAFDSVVPDDKPEFESSKPLAQRNLPMLEGKKRADNHITGVAKVLPPKIFCGPCVKLWMNHIAIKAQL